MRAKISAGPQREVMSWLWAAPASRLRVRDEVNAGWGVGGHPHRTRVGG